MKKAIHEVGSLLFCLENEALYLFLFWLITALEEGGIRQKLWGLRYSGQRKLVARPTLPFNQIPLWSRALLETSFRSLTHVSLSGPSC